MPIVRVEWLAGRDAATKERVATEITEVIARVGKTDPSHVWVVFNDVAPADWAVGGRFLAVPPAATRPAD